MLETRQKKIGEVEYQVRQLTAPVGRKLLVRLFKVLGPPLSAAFAGLPEGEGGAVSIGDLKTRALADAIMLLADTISEEELEHIVTVLAESTQYSKEPDKWLSLKTDKDFHWSGKFLNMFQWIAFCLEVNYADFLGGSESLAGFVSAIKPERVPPSLSQTE